MALNFFRLVDINCCKEGGGREGGGGRVRMEEEEEKGEGTTTTKPCVSIHRQLFMCVKYIMPPRCPSA